MHTLPPGPRSTSLTATQWIRDPLGLLQRSARRYGEPFTLKFWGLGPTVVTSSPTGLQQIFTAPQNVFASNIGITAGPLLGENSLFMIDGTRHRRERALLGGPFHGSRMRAYGEAMQQIALQHAARWPHGGAFRMYDVLQRISLEIIIRTIFGVLQPAQVRRISEAIVDYVGAYTPILAFFPVTRREFNGHGPWSRFRQSMEQFERMMAEEIASRRSDGRAEGEDILSLLVAARDEQGVAMSDAELIDELKSVIFAGHETVAIALAWAFYWAHRLPDVSEQVRAELAGLAGQPHPSDLQQLPYLGAVCDEALRLNPSVSGVPRKLKHPLELQGWSLPEGVAVLPAILTAHLNETTYPDPLAFRPERFLDRHYSPFQYLPFGGGSRRCLGAAFAKYEMKIVLGSILAQHRLALADQQPVRMMTRTFTNAPKGGIPMIYRGPVDAGGQKSRGHR